MGIPRRGTLTTNPAPLLPRYAIGLGVFPHPRIPLPCTRAIFSSSVSSFNTSSARSSGESEVFIHGCFLASGGFCPCDTRNVEAEETTRKRTVNPSQRVENRYC